MIQRKANSFFDKLWNIWKEVASHIVYPNQLQAMATLIELQVAAIIQPLAVIASSFTAVASLPDFTSFTTAASFVVKPSSAIVERKGQPSSWVVVSSLAIAAPRKLSWYEFYF